MMNGAHRVTIDGKCYTLVLDINALADLETVINRPVLELLEAVEANAATMTEMRAIFWAMFQAHHPDVDLRTAGRLLSLAPSALGATLTDALPRPAPSDAGAAEDNQGNA